LEYGVVEGRGFEVEEDVVIEREEGVFQLCVSCLF